MMIDSEDSLEGIRAALKSTPTPVPGSGPGVMMASEINTSQCRVAAAALTDAGFVELRLLTVVWALDRQDDDPSGIAEFGGE